VPRLLCLLTAAACLGFTGPQRPDPYFEEEFEEELASGAQMVQTYHEAIRLTGTPEFVRSIRAALDLLEAADPRNWYFVRKQIRKITLTGHSGMDVFAGRYTSGHLPDEHPAQAAGRLVHDAWHRELFRRGEPWTGREAEEFCLARQNEFLARAGHPPLDSAAALATGYWTVDYWLRDW
jgi:hypothetical protein